jgi:prevent-host-death family protein
MEVSVRDLKNRLSEYLRRIGQGEEVIVTSHRRPVARLVPLPQAHGTGETQQQVLDQLRRLPWIRPGRGGKPRGAKRPMRTGPRQKQASRIVAEGRR